MSFLTTLTTGFLLLLAVIALAFVLLGAERFWGFFGDPDLGPVVFEELERRRSPNDALACPEGLCSAPAELTTTLYPLTATQLRAEFSKLMAVEPKVSIADSNEATLTDRYIQRTPLLGYPDTVVVQFFDRPDDQSTIALYSRSQLGQSDLGANKARLERWLAELERQIAARAG